MNTEHSIYLIYCSLLTSIADNRLMTLFFITVLSHLAVPVTEYFKVF